MSHVRPEPAEPRLLPALGGLLRRRVAVGSSVVAVTLVASLGVLFLSRPVYRAEARLKIGEPPPAAGISPTGGLLNLLRTGGDPFANDMEVLTSRSVAEAVVRDVALSVRLRAPRGWYRDSVFVSLALEDTTAKATFEATWGDGTVTVRERSPERAEVGTFPVGTPAVFGGVRAVFAPRGPGGPTSVELRTIPFDEAVRLTSKRLKIQRMRRDANVLQVSYTRDEPGVAAAVVESAVQRFVELRVKIFERESTETVDSIRTVAAGTRRDLAEAEDSLEAVQRRTGLVATDAQSEALIDRYEAVYAAAEEARAERDALDAQTRRIGPPEDGVAWSMLVANPRFLENPTVGALVERLSELEATRTETLALRRPESLDVRTLDAEIAQLGNELRRLVSEYRTGLGERIVDLERRLRDLDAILGRLPAETLELGRRQRAVRILSEVLVVTEQRLRQEELRQALAFSNVQIVDPPLLRYRPVWPRKKLGVAVAVMLALGAGSVSMWVAERADSSLRTASQVRALFDLPVLASPVERRAWSEPGLEAVRQASGGRFALAGCPGDVAAVDGVAKALDGVCDVVGHGAVEDFPSAATLARTGASIVLVVRASVTSEVAVARTLARLRDAGGDVLGLVAVCGTPSAAKAFWT